MQRLNSLHHVAVPAFAGVLTLSISAFAASSNDEPSMDGLAAPTARHTPQLATTLQKPQQIPQRLQLPETRMPEKERRKMSIRLADLDHDGEVSAADLLLLMDHLGDCPHGEMCPDLNGDGVIDGDDVSLMLELFGEHLPRGEQSLKVKIGYVEPAPFDVQAPLARQPLGDPNAGPVREVSRVELASAGAGGLRVEIEGMREADAVEVRVYDPAGATVLGPYYADRADEGGRWWTPTIDGTVIGIELIHGPLAPGQSAPTVSRIAYIYAGGECAQCAKGPGNAMACHNCIACFPEWQNSDARAVGQMSWVSGESCVRCTGALLNRGPEDHSPLFMTAHHCIATQTEANTLEVRWLYETSNCAPCSGIPGFNDVPRNNGALLVKRHIDSDWTLLALFDPPNVPDGAFYLGWNAAQWPSGDTATGVHHPQTTHKRISFGESDGHSDNVTFCDDDGVCFEIDVWDVDYTSGTTEPGSSGSPIFDSQRHVRGTLTGGPPGCAPNTSRYGRMDLAYPNIRYFLANDSIPNGNVYVNGAVPGDPGNHGSSERGTQTNPFNDVREAVFCVRAGDTVRITPGNYDRSMTIWRPLTLDTTGSGGDVVIGAP